MNQIKAIGFDLFNTLITAEPGALSDALTRLTGSLAQTGICPEYEPFKKAYREAALQFIKRANVEGKETHNRFWISAALKTLGYDIGPDDPRISPAIEAYFSTFLDFCHPIPGTIEMLETLKGEYRLGLLSNFTHAPAAFKIIDHTLFFVFIANKIFTAHNTGFIKIVCHDSRMGSQSPSCSQQSICSINFQDIIGNGIIPQYN